MASEAQAALAFVARRQARRSMPAAEWAHVLSLGLGWMAPAQARAYVERARAAGLLTGPDGDLAVAFDPAAVEVPRGFRPDPGAAPAPPAPPGFLDWVDRVAQATSSDRPAVLGLVAKWQDRMGGLLTADAAVLCLAREAGLDVAAAARSAGEALRPAAAAPAPAGSP